MTVLVTGGSGYIGAHLVRGLTARGERVVVIDDGETGFRERIPGVEARTLDLAADGARDALVELLRAREVESVVHFAARKQVPESLARPAWYYAQNVGGLATLLLAMEEAVVRRLVFSSSAAVYGAVSTPLVPEDHHTVPMNPYGATKLAGEELIEAQCRTGALAAVSLRYFNVAGCGAPELVDRMALNLVPMVFERLARGERPLVFGDDYPTPDGSCVRDFVHVQDLAEAHLAALDRLREETPASSAHAVYNVGTGRGYSVLEVVDAIGRITGLDATPEIRPRRAGDPAAVVADPARILSELGWRARLGLDDMIASAWDGYREVVLRG